MLICLIAVFIRHRSHNVSYLNANNVDGAVIILTFWETDPCSSAQSKSQTQALPLGVPVLSCPWPAFRVPSGLDSTQVGQRGLLGARPNARGPAASCRVPPARAVEMIEREGELRDVGEFAELTALNVMCIECFHYVLTSVVSGLHLLRSIGARLAGAPWACGEGAVLMLVGGRGHAVAQVREAR